MTDHDKNFKFYLLINLLQDLIFILELMYFWIVQTCYMKYVGERYGDDLSSQPLLTLRDAQHHRRGE